MELQDSGIEQQEHVEEVDPVSVMDLAEAASKTISDPSMANMVNDIELALKLISEFKDGISKLHPAIGVLLRAIF